METRGLKVVFLDVDGVLNSEYSDVECEKEFGHQNVGGVWSLSGGQTELSHELVGPLSGRAFE